MAAGSSLAAGMADFISGLLFVVLSGALFRAASLLPAGRGNVPGPGFFPELAAVAGMIVGALICARALWSLRNKRSASGPTATPALAADWLRLLALIAACTGYVAAMRPVGFVISSILFLGMSLVILGERRLLVLALLPVGLTAGVLIIFTYLLGLRLPPGTLF